MPGDNATAIIHTPRGIYGQFTCGNPARPLHYKRALPPFSSLRLEWRRESSTLCTQGPERGPFFMWHIAQARCAVPRKEPFFYVRDFVSLSGQSVRRYSRPVPTFL